MASATRVPALAAGARPLSQRAAVLCDRGPEGGSQVPTDTQRAEDLKGLLAGITRSDPELVSLAERGLGALARTWFQAVIQWGEDFPEELCRLLTASQQEPNPASSTSTNAQRAIVMVAAHAVLGRIHELMTCLARERESRQKSNCDLTKPWHQQILSQRPGELLGELLEALLYYNGNKRLEDVVCREAAARVNSLANDEELARQVRRHVNVFELLASETYRVYSVFLLRQRANASTTHTLRGGAWVRPPPMSPSYALFRMFDAWKTRDTRTQPFL